jgi:4,5-DOPA dioxygenase extradiol
VNLNQLNTTLQNFPKTEKMPSLFIGHGSPMNAIEENQFVEGFRKIALEIEKPKAILCISAHWYTKGTKVTAVEMPKTIHDFSGFPEALYQVSYPAKGSPELASATRSMLEPIPVALDDTWGLDHGAWSILKHLYPDATIPVVEMSIDYTKPAPYHFELAQKLKSLRHRGVLIIGSGNMIHNLGLVDWKNFEKDNYGYDWALEARETLNDYILNTNYAPLVDFKKLSQAVNLAIPTPDHYLPLLYTLGLREKEDNTTLFNDKLLAGSISMTSVKLA